MSFLNMKKTSVYIDVWHALFKSFPIFEYQICFFYDTGIGKPACNQMMPHIAILCDITQIINPFFLQTEVFCQPVKSFFSFFLSGFLMTIDIVKEINKNDLFNFTLC